jgi:PEP-CTERM motif
MRLTRAIAAPFALTVAVAVTPLALTAQTTLTFDANACTGTGSFVAPSPYIESGFELTFTGGGDTYGAWCSSSPNYPGSPDIGIASGGEQATLTKVGGGTFSLQSIDLATLFGGGAGGSVFFTGDLSGGGTVTASGTFDAASGPPTFSTFNFDDSWTDLADVYFVQGPAENENTFQFDNVVLDSPVPEPGSMALLATGLVGMAGAGLRRRKRKA